MHRYRADNVDSLLRPAYLHHAREQYALGRISASEFNPSQRPAAVIAFRIASTVMSAR